MVEGSIEFVKFNNISYDKIKNNFSSLISDSLFYSCYEWYREAGEAYTCDNLCKGDFNKCYYANDLKEYNKVCWKTPKLFMIDDEELKKDYIFEYGEKSSPFDFNEPVHDVEDIIIRRNCNAIVIKQEVYRNKTKKIGYAVRALISPSIDDSDDCLDGYKLTDLYSKDRKWRICIWSPTFNDLFSIMSSNSSDIFLQILEELENNINQDTEVLVEKYLINEKCKTKNDNWCIKSIVDYSGEYYYEIDCRVLVSVIKQIMLCEDKLYNQVEHRGRGKIVDEFKAFLDKK